MDKKKVMIGVTIFLIIVSAIFLINSIIYLSEQKPVPSTPAEGKKEAPVELNVKESPQTEEIKDEVAPVEMEAPIKPGEPLLQ